MLRTILCYLFGHVLDDPDPEATTCARCGFAIARPRRVGSAIDATSADALDALDDTVDERPKRNP